MYSFKPAYPFVAFIFLYLSITYLTNLFVLTDSFYYSSFQDRLSAEGINNLISSLKRFQWVGYLLIPVVIFLKLLVISAVIYAGVVIFDQKILFKECLRIVMVAECVPLLAALIKFGYFLISGPSTVQEMQVFYPLSVLNILHPRQLPSYLIYPLQQLNLFEIIYWLLIAVGIRTFIKKSFGYSLKIVVSSYGVALSVWVLFVVFINLQFGS